MSIKIMSKVWDESSMSGTELLLMLSIADFSNEEGEAFPGIAKLSKKCRVSERTIQRAISKCVKSGE